GILEWYDFEKRKQEHIADEVGDISMTSDGKMVLYYSHDRLRVLKAGEKPPELPSPSADKPGLESGWLDLGRIKVSIHPGTEWREGFRGVDWRFEADERVCWLLMISVLKISGKHSFIRDFSVPVLERIS